MCRQLHEFRSTIERLPILHMAALSNNPRLLDVITSSNRSTVKAARDAASRSIAHFAADKCLYINEEILKCLFHSSLMHDSDTFVIACQTGYFDLKKSLVKYKTSLNLKTVDINKPGEETAVYPIHAACMGGQETVVQILLHEDVDIIVQNKHLETPLWISCSAGHANIVTLLLDNLSKLNIDVLQRIKYINQGDVHKKTPLMLCASLAHNTIISTLLQHHASVNSRDLFHNTALHLATEAKNEEGVRLLMQQDGVRTKMRNKDGLLAVDIAKKKKLLKIEETIEEFAKRYAFLKSYI